MQILSIHLKNIKSHRDTELTFSPGINVLSGPNGVGKSTVFEAIGYALFGVDASSFVGNVERFLTIGAKKGEVAVVFKVNDDERFRVTRTVGTPAKWLLAREVGGAFEVEEHKGIDETEARLKELLGLDNGRSLAEQFELVIGPFQNEFLGPFVIRQATKRRDKFDEILGIDAWRKTYNETKSLASAIAAKIKELEAAIGPLREQVAALPEMIEAHKAAVGGLEQVQRELAGQQQALKELETQLVEIDQREQKLKALGVEIDTLKGRIDNGKDKIGSQKALVGEAEKAKKAVAENADGKQSFEQAEKRLIELREQEKQRRQLEKEVADLTGQAGKLEERHAAEVRAVEQLRQELQGEEQVLVTKRQSLAVDEGQRKLAARLPKLRDAINEIRAQAGKLEGKRAGLEEGSEKLAEGICPFFQEPCLNIAERPPGDVFSSRFAELDTEQQRLAGELVRLEAEENEAVKADKQLNTVAAQLGELNAQVKTLAGKRKANEERAASLAELQKEQAEAQRLLAGKQQALKAYERLQADIDAAETEKNKHQEARDLYVANQEQAAKLEERQTELHKFEQLLAQLQKELLDRENDLKSVSKDYDADRHRTLREQKDTLGKEVGALGQKVEGLNRDVARLAGEIDKLRKIEQEIADKQAQIKTYGEKEELVKFLRNRVFRNVSGSLSERFREEISLRANLIYRTIAEADEELFWGEDYRIVLRDMADGELRERTDDQLSGGQTMSAVVALRLAMLQTIGARIAFFDEPTSNLDATRRENLAHAFRAIDVGKEEVTEHWYDQLFLISHDVAFTEVTDQVISLGG
jgi:exonuclease SbcC